MDYKEKYYKYKTKYLQLQNRINMSEHGVDKNLNINNKQSNKLDFTNELQNMYFVHNTKTIKSLLNIVKDGIIKPGKDVKDCFRFYSGGTPQKYIYSNVYFGDLKNLEFLKTSIILHPKLIYDYNITMTKGWMCAPVKDSIIINKTDINSIKLDKINQFKQMLLSNDIMEHVMTWPGFMQHEILFEKPIDVKKYVVAMVCPSAHKTKLEKTIKKYGYNIKVIPLETIKNNELEKVIIEPYELF